MRHLLLVTSASILLAAAASAQPGPATSDSNPAIKDSTPRAVPSPAEGESSFTEAQARDRLMKAGYSNVATLTKRDGSWHGTAMKDGKQVSVILDYQGNITTH